MSDEAFENAGEVAYELVQQHMTAEYVGRRVVCAYLEARCDEGLDQAWEDFTKARDRLRENDV